VVALDHSGDDLLAARATVEQYGGVDAPAPGGRFAAVRGDARMLPFADGSFDRVIAAEVLEHIPDDEVAVRELVRVLRPGGMLAVTVPRWWPERVCWALSDEYHQQSGGHVRIYRGEALQRLLHSAGMVPCHRHHAHALHSPYWWLRCALGSGRDTAAPVRLYHRFLVWDLMRRPALTRWLDRLLNPLLGKSLVLYAIRPPGAAAAAEATDRAAA
jgi:ubiquinone/menaquinone biosynthesis C-methylase UbiE